MYKTTFFLKREDNYSTKETYAVKTCKRPNATKVYKELELMFDNGEIAGYGWERE